MKKIHYISSAAFLTLLVASGGIFSGCGTQKTNSAQTETEVSAEAETTQYTFLPTPENPTETESYFWEFGDVVEVKDAQTSDDLMTESEAVELLKDRGFVIYNITYDYELDGTFVVDTIADEESADKHPMYRVYHMTNNGDVWSIYIIDGDVIANPVTYNLNSGNSTQLVVSEKETITSYDDTASRFYVTIPKESSAIVQTVEKIDASTLNDLAKEMEEQ